MVSRSEHRTLLSPEFTTGEITIHITPDNLEYPDIVLTGRYKGSPPQIKCIQEVERWDGWEEVLPVDYRFTADLGDFEYVIHKVPDAEDADGYWLH